MNESSVMALLVFLLGYTTKIAVVFVDRLFNECDNVKKPQLNIENTFCAYPP